MENITLTEQSPTNGPGESSIGFIGSFTRNDCEKIASRLDLVPETPSEGVETESWQRNGEEILLELGYGISCVSAVVEEVKLVLTSLEYLQES